MVRYYKPHISELTSDSVIDVFTRGHWETIISSKMLRSALMLEHSKGNIRMKYLDSFDFNELGYTVNKTFIGTQTQIIDIIPHDDKEDEEITEDIDIFNEEVLIILRRGIPVGKFMPWLPENNVEFKGKDYSIRNLTELRKILK